MKHNKLKPANKEVTFESIVEELKRQLSNLKLDDNIEKLKMLYDAYVTRFLAANNLIWTTGAIMIPLSLAPFAALPTLNCLTLTHKLTLAVISVTIFLSWLLIAENQRAIGEWLRAWIVAIEEVIGVKSLDFHSRTQGKIKSSLMNRFVTFKNAIQLMRWFLFALILMGWVLVIVLWPSCNGLHVG